MRLQNTQLRDQLENMKTHVLMSNELPREESIQLAKTIDSIQDDEMGMKVLKAIQESEAWQSIDPDRNNNSAGELELPTKEGPTMNTAHHHYESIKKSIPTEIRKDVIADIDNLIAEVRKEAGLQGLDELRSSINADLLAAGEKINTKLDKFSSVLATPGQQATAIGWRTLDLFGRLAITVGAVVFTAWVLKKMFEATTPAMAAVAA